MFCFFGAQAQENEFLARVVDKITAYKEDTGFVALYSGLSKYKDQATDDRTLGALFLVPLFEDYYLDIGAMTIASFSNVVSTSKTASQTEITEKSVSHVFQHKGYGTTMAFVYSTKSMLGFQMWGGVAFMKNEIEIHQKIVEEIERGNSSFQCSGESKEYGEFYSFPYYIGAGFTFNGFGFFTQLLYQEVPDITVKSQTTLRCLNGSSVEIRNHDKDDDINLSYRSVQAGIQYRF